MKDFQNLLQPVFNAVSGKDIGPELEAGLNDAFGPDSALFCSIEKACHGAIEAGWMCANGDEGRRFGRVIEPSDETGNLSVDVVQLSNIAGPHHRHPTGEVCMVMPCDETAEFDGHGAGWCVYAPGTAHYPTVRGGTALILYLLPGGEITFTGR